MKILIIMMMMMFFMVSCSAEDTVTEERFDELLSITSSIIDVAKSHEERIKALENQIEEVNKELDKNEILIDKLLSDSQ